MNSFRIFFVICILQVFSVPFSFSNEKNMYAQGIQEELLGNYHLAIEAYEISSNTGLSDAKFALGRIYRDIYHDDEQSFNWFLKASEDGNIFAQYEVGLLYRDGNGMVQKDIEKAKKWLVLSANKGSGDAAFALFELDKYSDNALLWLKKSAEYGVIDAMNELSNAYQYGLYGLKINKKLSDMWLSKVSDKREGK